MTDFTLGAAHRTLRDEVTAELRRRILAGELAQGERLVEDRLAAALGVSRNPVRESIRVLAAEGFIQVVPRIGATVARLSAEEGEELFDVRMAVEGLAARLAARKRGSASAVRLRQVLDCLLEGDSEKQVAARLGVTPPTVNQYVKAVYRHFRVNSRAELMARWIRIHRRAGAT